MACGSAGKVALGAGDNLLHSRVAICGSVTCNILCALHARVAVSHRVIAVVSLSLFQGLGFEVETSLFQRLPLPNVALDCDYLASFLGNTPFSEAKSKYTASFVYRLDLCRHSSCPSSRGLKPPLANCQLDQTLTPQTTQTQLNPGAPQMVATTTG